MGRRSWAGIPRREQADPEPGQKVGLPIEAWISEEGLPVRMCFKCGNAKESFDMTMDVLEYGVPVEVEPRRGRRSSSRASSTGSPRREPLA